MDYEIISLEKFDGVELSIKRTDDNGKVWSIPFDEANSDYQQYLLDTDGGLPLPE